MKMVCTSYVVHIILPITFQAHPQSAATANAVFYIHGSVHRESYLIIYQQDATVFSLLYFCRQLYMFRVLAPIIRSSYNCNYRFWHWSTGSTSIRSHCWVGTNSTTRASAVFLVTLWRCLYSLHCTCGLCAHRGYDLNMICQIFIVSSWL